jgi:hypothetical protein
MPKMIPKSVFCPDEGEAGEAVPLTTLPEALAIEVELPT